MQVHDVIDFVATRVLRISSDDEDQHGNSPSSSTARRSPATACHSKKVIIFAHHKQVLDTLEQQLCKANGIQYIRIDGDSNMSKRKPLLDEFQEDAACKVALLSITAVGVGVTLTAAEVVVFAELIWDPSKLMQVRNAASPGGSGFCTGTRFTACGLQRATLSWVCASSCHSSVRLV